MTKRLISHILPGVLGLLAAVLSLPLNAQAQKYSGQWTLFPRVGSSVENVVDTGDKVYFISGGNLFHFSPEDNETYAYTVENKISDTGVGSIWYDPQSKKLLVAFTNGNIDIIDPNGEVRNVADIKEAILSTSKGIKDVFFADNRAFLATDFGIVILNLDTLHIEQSGIYGFGPNKIMVTPDKYIVYFVTPNKTGVENNALYSAPRTGKINNFSAFTKERNAWLKDLLMSPDYSSFYATSSDGKQLLRYGTEDGLPVNNNYSLQSADAKILKLDTTGTVYCFGNSLVTVLAPDFTIKESYELPEEYRSLDGTIYKGLDAFWAGSTAGLGQYDLSSANCSVLQQPWFPEGCTVPYVHFMRYDKLNRLWVSNLGGTQLFPNGGDNNAYGVSQFVNIIEGNDIKDETVIEATTSWLDAILAGENALAEKIIYPAIVKVNSGLPYIMGGPNTVIPDPDDPDMFWTGNSSEGVYLCKDRKSLKLYSVFNAPYWEGFDEGDQWLSRVNGINIDPEGNLWVGKRANYAYPYMILPSSIRRERPTDVKREDWILHDFNGVSGMSNDMHSLFSGSTGFALFSSARYADGLYGLDSRGTWADPSDDIVVHHQNFTTKEGLVVKPNYFYSFVEDKDGAFWVTHSLGVFVIEDPRELTNPGMQVRIPLIPRNDGTNFADKLLDGVEVYCVAVDPINRKWFGTADNGLYLTNASGTKILAHYDTSNSNLVSNTILSVICDPNSNKIYVGTDSGLMSFNSDASPAENDYSQVVIYPNPVRPEYTGWVTISGLMDNSLVKIADMQGRVIFQDRSNGGSLIWDACDNNGRRVRSGVYLVLASQNGENGASGAVVGKIMVMN